jgi:hypothetical protein
MKRLLIAAVLISMSTAASANSAYNENLCVAGYELLSHSLIYKGAGDNPRQVWDKLASGGRQEPLTVKEAKHIINIAFSGQVTLGQVTSKRYFTTYDNACLKLLAGRNNYRKLK